MLVIKRTTDRKKIAMAKELGEIIAQRLLLEKREKEMKEYFRKRLGKQSAVLLAGDRKVVSTLCGRSILDTDALTAELGDLDPYKRDSSWTEISIEAIEPEGQTE
jgi:hypothetical protein